jgi:8-oxo-dGTP pyrophosphatase MutT (NUDIX family)
MTSHRPAPLTNTAVATFAAELAAWHPADPTQRELKDEYLAFINDRGASSLERDGGPTHITASCFVFNADRSEVLLCFHRKGRFWVQLGGHIEAGDASVADAALREGREEGGITDLTALRRHPVDLDRHGLGDGFGRCSVHWDVGYAVTAPAGAITAVSDESEDVAWWPVEGLPDNVPPNFGRRVAGVLRELAANPDPTITRSRP